MFHVLVPPNVNIFFKYLIPFVKFDILELFNDFENGNISPTGFLNLFQTTDPINNNTKRQL